MIATPEGRRFQAWAASCVFSCVCLAAHASVATDRNSAEDWVLAVLCISFIISFLAVVAYLFLKDKFIGEKPEGGVAFLLVIFWCAGLPVIMNPSRDIAVAGFVGSTFVKNANLYFCSWVTFICVLFIFGNYMQDFTGRDVVSDITPKQSKWMGLLASSIVIMAASSEIHSEFGCTSHLDESYCSRNAYAVSLGVIGTIFPMGVLYMAQTGKLTVMVEFAIATVMLTLFTFGVAFVTFGSGSGTTIGNLYFAMWIAFSISVLLGFQCFAEFMAQRNGDAPPQENKANAAAPPSIEEVEQATGVPTGGATEAVEVKSGV